MKIQTLEDLIQDQQTEKVLFTFDEFLQTHSEFGSCNIDKGFSLSEILGSASNKLLPRIELAKPEDALELSQIFREIYKGTYPYKEFEDEMKFKKMIEDPKFYWFKFLINKNKLIGCIGFHVDSNKKCGTLHGLVIKEIYQGLAEIPNLIIGIIYSIIKKFRNIIFHLSCEVRASHNKSQFFGKVAGLLPVGFLPNKDLFYNRVESEFVIILYDRIVFKEYRIQEKPKIVYPILNCYAFASKIYNIGLPILEPYTTNIKYNRVEIKKIRRNLVKHIIVDENGNSYCKFTVKTNGSFFKFFHNKIIQNIERTEFKIENKEELHIFLQEAKKYIFKNGVRYFEFFFPVNDPIYQIILLEADFKPFGYIPSYNYNRMKDIFEDVIIFVYFRTETNNLQLISETREFLEYIKPDYVK